MNPEMNPEKQSGHPDLPRLPEEELAQNEPRDEELFIDDALNVYLRDIAPNKLEQEEPGPEKYCMRRDFIESYAGSFETRSDFIHEQAIELGWYEALHFACEMGNVPTAVVSLSIPNAFDYLSRYYDVLEGVDTDRLYAFRKGDVEPPEIQIRLVQKGEDHDEQ